MESPIKDTLLILHQTAKVRQTIAAVFSGQPNLETVFCNSIVEAINYTAVHPVFCVILGETFDGVNADAFFKTIEALLPETPVILIAKKKPKAEKKAGRKLPGKKRFAAVLENPVSAVRLKNSVARLRGTPGETGKPAKTGNFQPRFQPDEKLMILRTALDILAHDTKNIFLKILATLSEMPESSYTNVLNDYVHELFESFSEALGSMGVKKRIESLIDIINSVRLGRDRIPLPSHSRIELSYDSRKLLYSESSRLLKNAIANIVENALKYSRSDSKVRINISYQSAEIIVSVADRGIGIPESDRRRIFQRNFRSSNSGSREGSGLGLWIADNIIREEGGKIRVKKNPPGGTIFYISLPAFCLEKSELTLQELADWFKLPREVIEKKARIIKTILLMELPNHEQAIDSLVFANLLDHLRLERKKREQHKYFMKLKELTRSNPDGKKVLLVDDSLYVHYSIAPILTEHGFRIVDFAYNGVEACNMYLIYTPELTIMDITMPVKSGIEAAQEIYKKYPRARIIFLTALGEYKPLQENIESLFRNRNYRILTKPIRPELLLEAVTVLFTVSV